MKKFTHIEALYQVARSVRKMNKDPECPDKYKLFGPVTFRGTIKLHGANAAAAVTADRIIPQSRSRELALGDDNHGFALFLSGAAQTAAIREIESRIRAATGIPDEKLTLFGEWCGPGIQRGCGIHQVPDKQFVLFAVVRGEGDEAQYLDAVPLLGAEFADARIFSILDGPTFEVEINLSDPDQLQAAADKLDELTRQVEELCPWAAKFGAVGIGEGIVWTPTGAHWGKTFLYFKTKGAKHKVTARRERVALSPETLAGVEQFVEFMVTENRLNQGLDHLHEQGLEVGMRSMGAFLKWFSGDVSREGAAELEANGLTWKEVAKAVTTKARNWFIPKAKAL
jgi:hypothetical protein